MCNDYPLFVHWYQTLDWILSAVERFPKHARFSVASRIAEAALDTLDAIVEAIYTKDRLDILNNINLLLERQRILFRLAGDRRYISMAQQEHIANALDATGRMVGGWRRKILEENGTSAGTGHDV